MGYVKAKRNAFSKTVFLFLLFVLITFRMGAVKMIQNNGVKRIVFLSYIKKGIPFFFVFLKTANNLGFAIDKKQCLNEIEGDFFVFCVLCAKN